MSLDHVDVASLMKQLVETRMELMKLHAQNERLETRFQEYDKKFEEINGELRADRTAKDSNLLLENEPSEHSSVNVTDLVGEVNHASLAARGVTFQDKDRETIDTYLSMAKRGVNMKESHARDAARGRKMTDAQMKDKLRPTPGDGLDATRDHGRFIQDEDGFITRVKKRKNNYQNLNPPVKGTRKGTTLRIAPASTKCQVFVYNLHPDYSAEEMECYVKSFLNDSEVTVTKPALKRTDSTAFVVTAHRRHRDTLMNGDSWEEETRVHVFHPPRQPRGPIPAQHEVQHDPTGGVQPAESDINVQPAEPDITDKRDSD